MKTLLSILFTCCTLLSFSQKKVLDHADFDIWNSIKNTTISPNGDYIMYSLEKGEKDNFLKIKDRKANTVFTYNRASKGVFSYDSKFAVFIIKAWKDSITELKRRKVKKNKLPKDSIGIYDIRSKSLTKIGNIKSYKTPLKWSGFIAYQFETTAKKKGSKKKEKKASAKNGYHLVLKNLANKKQDTFKFVTHYTFAEKGQFLAFTTTGDTKKDNSSVQVYNLKNNTLNTIYQNEKAKYYQLNFSETGKNLAFVVDKDTTKTQRRPNELYHWKEGLKTAQKLADNSSSPKGYKVSAYGRISFSKDETKLFFGLATPEIVKDTTLIAEEIVNVEVWTYNEPRLYTVQELQVKNDKKKSYQTVIHLKNNKIVQIANTKYPSARLGSEGNAAHALVENPEPYQIQSQWDALRLRDIAIVDVKTGNRKKILTKISSRNVRLSPNGQYVFGYNNVDKTWFTYNISTSTFKELTANKVFYNELHDSPSTPRAYGTAGWTKDDNSLILYDRFDIWEFNPDTGKSTKITNGRENNTVYRYVKLDREEQFLNPKGKWLFSTFNEQTKASGYYQYNPKNKKGKQLIEGDYNYSRIQKAVLDDAIIYTRESFTEFPNIRYSDINFKNSKVISDANPQQKEYNWGTNELVNWTSLDGKKLTGMLVKPENFDPNKKYPMIVNFYEKSSDRLHRHIAPSPGRSTINYSFYTSRGYVIFNPDVYYREGYPGESAFNCVIPGITSLIEKGFIDKDNIGVQGHSWGGYQIAYLVTKTDIFKAAESGAPVVNMISAYGGIRWWTGLSRQFQYEHTQSRIGGTPWQYPARYIENSPIFNIDKINTPLLIMHNDADGHVPWYQGIEFFTALRRLQKPSWFLNYNGEPHWPLKTQNRKDFNIRMAQFFDYYLKGAPKPVWMDKGVPAIEKGINQGYELIEEKN
ncbi:S9 family peptidase [Polaribacter septentrionalilitoris]|uniref:S9 family peptidase n=1 Tax=Polaribacter septentrionalilitoris TaxID=2494657 RepID=UPI0013576EA5|nr:prolyl oligopeptidase family serine peptidase [Polaribacter septentrionalilitoris]